MIYAIMPVVVAIVSSKTERVVTTPEANRSARVEERLKAFGYGIQLNLFSDEK